MDNFINPLGNNIDKRVGFEDLKYFVEFNNTSAYPIVSPYDGIVLSTRETDNGYTIKIEHNFNNNKIETKFENLSTLYVSSGQQVSKQQKIGMTGRKRVKLFITNKTTNKSEKPKDWIRGEYLKTFDTQDKTSEKDKTTDTKQSKEVEKIKTSGNNSKDEKGLGLYSLMAGLSPFALAKKGVSSVFKDVEKEKEKKEELIKQKEIEKRKKEEEEKKKKEEEEKKLKQDIQFEDFKKNIVQEEINRIKQLLK